MGRMGGNRYRLIGYVAWRGAKWYLRGRLPSRRRLLAGGLAAGLAASAGVAAARRLSR